MVDTRDTRERSSQSNPTSGLVRGVWTADARPGPVWLGPGLDGQPEPLLVRLPGQTTAGGRPPLAQSLPRLHPARLVERGGQIIDITQLLSLLFIYSIKEGGAEIAFSDI